jgi:hypothetical protein
VYANALLGTIEAQRAHAQDHLRRCGRACASVLSERFAASSGAQTQLLAEELAILAPEQAAPLITARIARAKPRERRGLRVVLARAAAANEARASVTQLLVDPALPNVAALDLLRALGPRAPSFLPEVGQTLGRLQGDTSFATRYLLLAPASLLSANDPNARALLTRALSDSNEPRLRVRALEVSPRDPASGNHFVTALSDPDVRVREAAANALRESRFVAAGPKLISLLADDSWPIARRAAADALAALPAEPKGDEALLDALSDEAPWVRASVATALGVRRVSRAAPALRERLEDKQERFEVRRASVSALAALCDQQSVGALSDLAKRLADPMATVEERAIGEASLQGLALIGPSDLATRLAPLKGTRAEPAVKHARESAAHSKTCGRR